MKKTRLSLIVSFILFYIYSQAQGVMIYKGGDYEYYASDDIDSMVFVTDVPKENLLEGQKYIDLGLPSGTLWATCNIGASRPNDHGWYFAWGETSVKSHYSPDNYSLVSVGNTRDLYDSEDVAMLMLGGKWRMPTDSEFQELMDKCEWAWEKYRNTQGCRVTGPNGNSIFLPAASFKDDHEAVDTAMYGSYWGRTFNMTNDGFPCGTELVFGIVDYEASWTERNFYKEFGPTGYCYCGRSIRPVYAEKINNYINNPNFDNNDYSGWDGTQFSGSNPNGNAEHFNKNYDTYQTISGLKAGKYRLGVQGFYRKGSYNNDYACWLNSDTEHNYSVLYATSSIGTYSIPLQSASSAALPIVLGGNVKSLVNPNTSEVLYIPDDMLAGSYWFDKGYYQNFLLVDVGSDGILKLGIKKDSLIENDWTLVDNWTLIYIDSK